MQSGRSNQGRRQGVTTENFSRGPQAKGGPRGAPRGLIWLEFFFQSQNPDIFRYFWDLDNLSGEQQGPFGPHGTLL